MNDGTRESLQDRPEKRIGGSNSHKIEFTPFPMSTNKPTTTTHCIHPSTQTHQTLSNKPTTTTTTTPYRTLHLTTRSLNVAGNAVPAIGTRTNLLGLAGRGALVQPAGGRVGQARVPDGGGVAVVGVDAGHDGAAVDLDVGEGGVAGVLGAAVAARPVQLADVLCVKVLDRDRAGAVVLEHLVAGAAGTAAVDVRRPARLLEGRRVLADVGPPAGEKGLVYGQKRHVRGGLKTGSIMG